MAAKKTVIPPENVNYRVTLLDPYQLRVSDLDKKSSESMLSVCRIQNHLDESICVLNEFGEVTIINSNANKVNKILYITYSNVKFSPGSRPDEVYGIELQKKHFDIYGCLYVKELNVVIALTAVFQYYIIRHPYSIISYADILNGAVQSLLKTIGPISFILFVNEPEKTAKQYYINFGDEILEVPKTHLADTKTSLTIINPKSDIKYNNYYDSMVVPLTDLDNNAVKEVKYVYGKTEYAFFISNLPNLVLAEQEKSSKIRKNMLSKTEHERLIANMEKKHNQDMKALQEKQGEEVEKLISTFGDQVKLLEKERDNLQSYLDATNRATAVRAGLHKDSATIAASEAKRNSAEVGMVKEQLSIWSDLLKYGLGGLITLATILVTIKTTSK